MRNTKPNSRTSSKAAGKQTSTERNSEIDLKLKSKLDQFDPALSEKLVKGQFNISEEIHRQDVLNDLFGRLIDAAEIDHPRLISTISEGLTCKQRTSDFGNEDNVWAMGAIGQILTMLSQNKWFMEKELEHGEKRLEKLTRLKSL